MENASVYLVEVATLTQQVRDQHGYQSLLSEPLQLKRGLREDLFHHFLQEVEMNDPCGVQIVQVQELLNSLEVVHNMHSQFSVGLCYLLLFKQLNMLADLRNKLLDDVLLSIISRESQNLCEEKR